jgi:hypothetical protein
VRPEFGVLAGHLEKYSLYSDYAISWVNANDPGTLKAEFYGKTCSRKNDRKKNHPILPLCLLLTEFVYAIRSIADRRGIGENAVESKAI